MVQVEGTITVIVIADDRSQDQGLRIGTEKTAKGQDPLGQDINLMPQD